MPEQAPYSSIPVAPNLLHYFVPIPLVSHDPDHFGLIWTEKPHPSQEVIFLDARSTAHHSMVINRAKTSIAYQRLAIRRLSFGECWLLSWLTVGTMMNGSLKT